MNDERGAVNTQPQVRSPVSVHRFSFALIAILAAMPFVVPLLRGEVFTVRDHFDYFQPLRWYTAMELKGGRLPQWNPYNASGEPWLANPQTGVFYPPAWLHVVLPFGPAYMLYLLFHVVLLGWGAYLFFARDASPGAAMVGAVALIFSGPLLSLLDVSNNYASLAWIPIALWCAAEGAWRRGGVALALSFLAGEPFFASVGAVLFAIVAWRRGSGKAALLAFGLSAIQLFPFLAFVGISDRAGGTDAGVVLHDAMTLREWMGVAVPSWPTIQGFIPVVYAGVVVVALALAGIGRRTIGWLVLLLFAIVVSTGPALLAQLPLTLFRYPARLVPLGAFALVALAVAGWNRLRPERRWADLVVIAAVIVDLAPHMGQLLRSAPFRTDVVPYAGEVGANSKFLRVGPVDPRKRTEWIAGYLNLYDRRFDAFTPAPAIARSYVERHRELLDAPTREELARRGIEWIVTSYDLAFEPVVRHDGVTLYRNRDTLTSAVLMMRAPMRIVVLGVAFDSSRVEVTVDAPHEGLVVLHQQRAPGWRVFIDGVEAREVPIHGLFRGVQVTRGPHRIVWKYRAPGLLSGALVTIFSLIALTLFSFVKRAR